MKRLTLQQLARRANISESTLRAYIRAHGTRIPSEGNRRNRRYPVSAVSVVREIRNENLQRKLKRHPGYYTLKDISQLTGISQTTLAKYQTRHADEIPSQGEGRKRIYPREAIAVFRRYRRKSRRGPAGRGGHQPTAGGDTLSGLARRLESVEKLQRRTNKLLTEVLKQVKRPINIRVIRG